LTGRYSKIIIAAGNEGAIGEWQTRRWSSTLCPKFAPTSVPERKRSNGTGAYPPIWPSACDAAASSGCNCRASWGVLNPTQWRDVVQATVARAEAALRAGRAFLSEAVTDLWETVLRGDQVTLHQRAIARLATVHAARASVEAVDLCYEAGGSTSIYGSDPRTSACYRFSTGTERGGRRRSDEA
jgi:Acyl-CoA dehydrogenase, C-terminal domain